MSKPTKIETEIIGNTLKRSSSQVIELPAMVSERTKPRSSSFNENSGVPESFTTIEENQLLTLYNQLSQMEYTKQGIQRALRLGARDIETALDLLEMELPREICVEVSRSTTCMICSQPTNEVTRVVVSSCTHTFCATCIKTYLEIRIKEAQVLAMPCPDFDCLSEIPEDLTYLYVSKECWTKYMKFKRNEELAKNQNLRWCPQPDCEGYDTGSMSKTTLTCNVCSYLYCYYCGEAPHPNKKCKHKADYALDKWSKKRGAKFCPNCKSRVEKNDGCNHMTCTKCRYEWCWLCGEKYFHGHLEECQATKLKKRNPSWWVILGLIFAPILLPFVFTIATTEQFHIELRNNSRPIARLARDYSYFSYPIFVVLCLLCTPIVYAIAPFAMSILLACECLSNSWESSLAILMVGFVFGILMTPVITAVVLLGFCVAPVVGVAFCVVKLYIFLRRCKDPGFMQPLDYANF